MEHASIVEPNSMALATADSNGYPSVRFLLLKGYDKRGFQFFTNKGSRKGLELTSNPHASLAFYWQPLKRQIRIEGDIVDLSEEESTAYFDSRPRASRVAACTSKQSSVLPDRKTLTEEFERLTEQYGENEPIPKPKQWGGYLLIPKIMEFWQGQTTRLHDRIRFRRHTTHENDATTTNANSSQSGEDAWIIERLAP